MVPAFGAGAFVTREYGFLFFSPAGLVGAPLGTSRCEAKVYQRTDTVRTRRLRNVLRMYERRKQYRQPFSEIYVRCVRIVRGLPKKGFIYRVNLPRVPRRICLKLPGRGRM